jgi:aspartyl-tRNA(Asn)/glutamyl-tRNA(Gln) amidotransferase subunit C
MHRAMEIKEDMLDHVAKIARLELTEQERKEFLPQLAQIIDTFSDIKEVDTSGVEPSFHPVKLAGMLRKDDAKKSLSSSQALKNSRNNKDGYIKGPKIL